LPIRDYILISYAREDRDRISRLVKRLDRAQLTVWWDDHIEPGTSFRRVIDEHLDHAACVVVAWSVASVDSDFVRSEATRAQQRGVLVPVLLDADARIPVGFTELHHVDLTGWIRHADGNHDDPEMAKLLSRALALANRGSRSSSDAGTLETSNWAVQSASQAATETSELTKTVHSFRDVFLSASAPLDDVRGALEEVDKTYKALIEAIDKFITPALKKRPIDGDAFVAIEGDRLIDQIESGRGHCDVIASHYFRYGGVRAWLQAHVDAQVLERADEAFSRLSTADGDLFRNMSQIGSVLQNEASAIVNMLAAGQDEAARLRILRGRERLQPLRDQLTQARRDLQQCRTSMGIPG
jgi:hypothetical protein